MEIVIILFAVVFLLVLILVGIIYLTKRKYPPVYKPKGPYLLSTGEKKFFDALTHAIGPDLYICPKVRIADILDVNLDKDGKEFWRALNRINQKHVDFVLVETNDFAPVLVLELDGGSHHDPERARRDAFVDSAFQSAGIPILHVPAKGYYDYKILAEQILSKIKT